MNNKEPSTLDCVLDENETLGATQIESPPSVTFESITFSDGQTIQLDPTDVVVLVGPNNAGKSLALRELEEHIGETLSKTVIKATKHRITGTKDDLGTFLSKNVHIRMQGSTWSYSGYGLNFNSNDDLKKDWPNNIRHLRSLFCQRIPTDTRIRGSDPPDAIDFLEHTATHPTHMLYWDDQLEERISGYFRSAFGQDLILFRSGGRKVPLLVGQRPLFNSGEDRVSRTYVERLLQGTVPLHEQGDGMRSFATVVLHLLAPTTPTVLLLDEPEAFLHPSQAPATWANHCTRKNIWNSTICSYP